MTKYHSSGIWVEKKDDSYIIGLSEKGQDDTGEVMFVDLPHFGKTVKAGDTLVSVEGAKSVTEIIFPFGGVVQSIHKDVEDNPDLLNKGPKSENWIVELTDVNEEEFDSLNDDPWEDN